MASIHITPVKWDLAICVRNEIILGRMWGSLAGELQAAFLKEVVSDMGLCRMWRYIITLVSPRREGWCRVCRWLTLLPLPHVYSGEASDRACVTEDSEHPSSCQKGLQSNILYVSYCLHFPEAGNVIPFPEPLSPAKLFSAISTARNTLHIFTEFDSLWGFPFGCNQKPVVWTSWERIICFIL